MPLRWNDSNHHLRRETVSLHALMLISINGQSEVVDISVEAKADVNQLSGVSLIVYIFTLIGSISIPTYFQPCPFWC